ncbi:MAG TPA: succinate dehydrogenase assembly factor 2 [Candidatus Desulfobacillus sp.]|nr:succinate dehydrogenase assembly factor 2 [Candidatus Desulfobacillus sp.]
MDEARAARLRRLRWHSRRALLELDLVFQRYWQRAGDAIEANDEAQLERLVAMEDHDLWDLLSGRRESGDAGVRALVERLRQP